MAQAVEDWSPSSVSLMLASSLKWLKCTPVHLTPAWQSLCLASFIIIPLVPKILYRSTWIISLSVSERQYNVHGCWLEQYHLCQFRVLRLSTNSCRHGKSQTRLSGKVRCYPPAKQLHNYRESLPRAISPPILYLSSFKIYPHSRMTVQSLFQWHVQ